MDLILVLFSYCWVSNTIFFLFPLKYRKIPEGPIPPTTPKYAYGPVVMKRVCLCAFNQKLIHFLLFSNVLYQNKFQKNTRFVTTASDDIRGFRNPRLLRPCEKHVSKDFPWTEPGMN